MKESILKFCAPIERYTWRDYLNWRHTCLCTRWSWIGRRGLFSRLRNHREVPPDIWIPPPFLRSPCYPRRRLARCNRNPRTAIFHPRRCYFWKNRKEVSLEILIHQQDLIRDTCQEEEKRVENRLNVKAISTGWITRIKKRKMKRSGGMESAISSI